MNKPTRFIIAVLTVIFLIGQIAMGTASVILAINLLELFLSGLPNASSILTDTFGIDMSFFNIPFISERQFVILLFLFGFVVMIGTFFLFQYLRTILLNLNEGEVFSEYNLKYIRRIMILYLGGGILNFIYQLLPIAKVNTGVISGTGDLIMGFLQILMTTAGIYTLYFVFKYGVRLKKDNEEII